MHTFHGLSTALPQRCSDPLPSRWTAVVEHTSPLILALVIDGLLGEPPNALHPVAWFGRFIQALEQRAPRDQPRLELLYGAGIALSGGTMAVLTARVLERMVHLRQPNRSEQPRGISHGSRTGVQRRVAWLLMAAMLKTTFAWRELIRAGERVRSELEAENPAGARQALRALVSRDTSDLDAPRLAAAVIESLAENASDSFVAPLLYYQLFGLAGAFAYRAVNTMDSMLGYRGRYEFLGKVPARLDDVLNWVPARLTALSIVAVAQLVNANPRRAWAIMWRDHVCTASPNAGYPMSAMAGALDICLEKAQHYRLHPEGRAPGPDDIRRAAQIVTLALGFMGIIGMTLPIATTYARQHTRGG